MEIHSKREIKICNFRTLGKPKNDFEKLRRRKNYEEKQREIRRKKRQRKVISTKAKSKKRKRITQITACPECGDFHSKKSDICKVRELKVKMIVQQIMKHSENIKVIIYLCIKFGNYVLL